MFGFYVFHFLFVFFKLNVKKAALLMYFLSYLNLTGATAS